MTAMSTRSLPLRRRVAEEQLRAVGLSLRKEAVILVVMLLVVAVLVLFDAWRSAHLVQPIHLSANGVPYANVHPMFEYGPLAAIPMAVIGLFLPYGVWGSGDASPRAYMRSLPVAWFDHSMMRVAAGWAWLMVAVAGYLVWIVLLNVGAGVIAGGLQSAHIQAWEWLVPFTAATLAYVVGSIAVVGSKHPLQWILGVILGWLVLGAAIDISTRPPHVNWMATLFEGEYGLAAAMFGDISHYVSAPAVIRNHPIMQTRVVPDLARWLWSTLIWGVPALGALFLVAARKRDD